MIQCGLKTEWDVLGFCVGGLCTEGEGDEREIFGKVSVAMV